MDDLFVWGLSKWRDFEQCPMMFKAKYILKDWQDAPNAAMQRGSWVHKQLEDAVRYELQLPNGIGAGYPDTDLTKFQSFVDQMVASKLAGADVVPELKVGISINYQRVDYFKGDRLRVRCVFDLYHQKERKTLLVDYKTGRYKPEHKEDAEFYGAICHMSLGSLTTDVMYLYVDEPQNSFTHSVEDAAAVLPNWWKKFEYADRVIAAENVPVTPCNACSWCGYAKCPKNRNKRLGNG